MLKRFILYITLFTSVNGLAQPYLSDGGDFSVDQSRGCRDLQITVTNINPGDGVILYQYEGKSSTVTNANNFTYTTTGNFWLYQYIQGPTGEKADSLFIEIFDPEIVDFTLESCNNNNVIVRLDNTTYDEYEIDYGDGTIIQVPVFGLPPAHSFGSAGPFNIRVAGLYTTANNQCGANSQSYTPVNIVQPALINKIEVLDLANIIVDYTLAPFTSSTLEVSLNGNTSYQTLVNLEQGTTGDTLSGLNLNSTYCFRIASNDACSNFKVYSNEICSISLEANAVNDAIDLSWQSEFLANFMALDIIRNDTLITSLTNPTNVYSDNTTRCENDYCYQLEMITSDGGISLSQLICITAFSTTKPATISDMSTSIVANSVTWTWPVPPGEEPGIFRILNEDGINVANTSQNAFNNELTQPTSCLVWEFTNSCGNTSDFSRSFCPLVIEYQITGSGSTLLSWPPFEGWQNGVNGYALLIYDQNMILADSIWLNSNTSYEDPLPIEDNQVSLYQVIAVARDVNLTNSQSNLLRVERPPVISLPSSFTPNGDGLNDFFEITGKYIMSQELTIFNRWGAILFSSESDSWDGTFAGKKVELGSYIYQVKVKDFAGKEHIRTGSVLILKN